MASPHFIQSKMQRQQASDRMIETIVNEAKGVIANWKVFLAISICFAFGLLYKK